MKTCHGIKGSVPVTAPIAYPARIAAVRHGDRHPEPAGGEHMPERRCIENLRECVPENIRLIRGITTQENRAFGKRFLLTDQIRLVTEEAHSLLPLSITCLVGYLPGGGEQRLDGRVIAKRLAQMRVNVPISRAEHKASAKLEGVDAQAMLLMATGASARARGGVIPPQQMQDVSRFEACGFVRNPVFVNQQRKRDPRFFPKEPGVVRIAQPDGSQPRSRLFEFVLVLAQLRDVLTAEDSSVVTEKNHDRRPALPE